jgi:hypothetical protein
MRPALLILVLTAGSASAESRFDREMVAAHNEIRAQAGVPPLKYNAPASLPSPWNNGQTGPLIPSHWFSAVYVDGHEGLVRLAQRH